MSALDILFGIKPTVLELLLGKEAAANATQPYNNSEAYTGNAAQQLRPSPMPMPTAQPTANFSASAAPVPAGPAYSPPTTSYNPAQAFQPAAAKAPAAPKFIDFHGQMPSDGFNGMIPQGTKQTAAVQPYQTQQQNWLSKAPGQNVQPAPQAQTQPVAAQQPAPAPRPLVPGIPARLQTPEVAQEAPAWQAPPAVPDPLTPQEIAAGTPRHFAPGSSGMMMTADEQNARRQDAYDRTHTYQPYSGPVVSGPANRRDPVTGDLLGSRPTAGDPYAPGRFGSVEDDRRRLIAQQNYRRQQEAEAANPNRPVRMADLQEWQRATGRPIPNGWLMGVGDDGRPLTVAQMYRNVQPGSGPMSPSSQVARMHAARGGYAMPHRV